MKQPDKLLFEFDERPMCCGARGIQVRIKMALTVLIEKNQKRYK